MDDGTLSGAVLKGPRHRRIGASSQSEAARGVPFQASQYTSLLLGRFRRHGRLEIETDQLQGSNTNVASACVRGLGLPFSRVRPAVHVKHLARNEGSADEEQRGIDDFLHCSKA